MWILKTQDMQKWTFEFYLIINLHWLRFKQLLANLVNHKKQENILEICQKPVKNKKDMLSFAIRLIANWFHGFVPKFEMEH